ncbi:MAG: Rieske 2Fe-2S domain-containing protein [Candidatus Acidiferrales bacterium]
MSEKKEERDYTGWVLVTAGAVFGWLTHKLFSREIATSVSAESASPDAPHRDETTAAVAATPGEPEAQDAAEPAPIFASEVHGPRQKGREQVGTLFVVCAFSVAFGAAIGFLFAYWTGSRDVLLGGTMALSLGAFGAGLVVWAHRLMNHEQVVEARETLPSGAREREAVSKDFFAEHQVQRRRLLIGMSAGVLGTFAVATVSLLRSLGKPPGPSLKATIWTRGQRLVTMEGHPVSVDTLQPGNTISVFPENDIGSVDAQAVLVRVDENLLRLPSARVNWAPSGYLAYSRVCTHAGCSVGVYEAETCLLQCPCHQSTFDVLAAARPTGGPAARPLPQLPLYADEDGNLRAGGDFSGLPGPGFWGMP